MLGTMRSDGDKFCTRKPLNFGDVSASFLVGLEIAALDI